MFTSSVRVRHAFLVSGVLVSMFASSMAFAGDHAAKNKAVVEGFMNDVCNARQLGRLGEFFAEDYVEHRPAPGAPPGIEGLRAMLGQMEEAFPDVVHTIDDIVASGDLVGFRATVAGTHKGSMMGMPATGKEISVAAIGIVRVKDGKIIEHWGNSDDVRMMRQLGMVPDEGVPPAPPEAAPDRLIRDTSVPNDDALATTARWLEVFDHEDYDVLDELIADGYQDHGPAIGLSDVQAMKDFMAQLKGAFPDMVTKVEATVAEGGMVATHWSATMTHTGDFMGMPATGKTVHMTGSMFDRVSGGQIHDHWEIVDEMAMMAQLGQMPAMDESMGP